MRLKIYRAPAMAEAMARLRAELGPDAMILGARTLRDGVELTAAIETAGPAGAAPAPIPAGARTTARPAALPAWRPEAAAREPAFAAVAAFHAIPETLRRRMTAPDLAAALAQAFRFAPLAPAHGPLLFVGPPGAGKTSTVARLATRLVLAGQQPMVVTADGRRAGATEQLAAYTRLLGLNLVVATHPTALNRALSRREADAPLLIDAPGTDSHDPTQMQELLALADAADARLALVMPAGQDALEGTDMVQAYAAAGADLAVTTRLDLVRRLGSLLAAIDGGGIALAEAGTGPGAADGLSPHSPASLAARLQRTTPRTAQEHPHA